MKKILMIFSIFLSTVALADLETQMKNLQGDWDMQKYFLVNERPVLRIEKQSETTVEVSFCARDQYYQTKTAVCDPRFVRVYQYRSDIDSFFNSSSTRYCSTSLQVSSISSDKLLTVINPYAALNEGLCHAGSAIEAVKIKP